MADANNSIQMTIAKEGGFQQIPGDKGNWLNGINYGTKWGITPHTLQAYFPNLLTNIHCVRDLDMVTAVSCYRQGYWKQHYGEINDQAVADKLFDMGVLFGVGTATKLLQIALTTGIIPVPTGVFGPLTLAAVNAYEGDLLASYRVVLINHVMDVVNQNPEDAQFLHGWSTRIQS